jgi:hypothetical protein
VEIDTVVPRHGSFPLAVNVDAMAQPMLTGTV